ncbi:hypothetical protein ACFSTC_21010 [Nonomuraea ferruginea]
MSVFVAPFTAAAAAEVAGDEEGIVAEGLARLAEQSLLVVTAAPGGTGYRALETIRQYGMERLSEADELAVTRSRHVRWCLERADGLAVAREGWRAGFDAVADDLRAALTWAADRPERRAEAYRLARCLAELTFTRNLIGESQERYEQAAALAGDDAAAPMLRQAAAVAGCRMRGDDMYRLQRAAADAARRSGDLTGAACDLATAAANACRFSGKFVRELPPEETDALITRARELAERRRGRRGRRGAGRGRAGAHRGRCGGGPGRRGPGDDRPRGTSGRARPPHGRPARRVRRARHAHLRPELGR